MGILVFGSLNPIVFAVLFVPVLYLRPLAFAVRSQGEAEPEEPFRALALQGSSIAGRDHLEAGLAHRLGASPEHGLVPRYSIRDEKFVVVESPPTVSVSGHGAQGHLSRGDAMGFEQ